MKKTVSILFLAIYLLSTTQLSEFLKLPLLVKHYVEHKEENKNITLLGFLDMHYAHGSPHDADYDKDMQLPFKTIVLSNISAISFCVPVLTFKLVSKVQFNKKVKCYSKYSFNYTSAFISAIWQPPKFY